METLDRKEVQNVLIIDDEVDTCYLIRIILDKKNIKSTCATSLAEAKAALSRQSPSLIFLDNQLPDGWGIDFIEFIKDSNPGSKIILYSAFYTPESRKYAIGKGADYIMNKPFTRLALESAVDSIVNSPARN